MLVYLIRCEENNYYKIGVTKNIQRRLKQIQTGNPDKAYLIEKYESKYANKIEKTLHNYFQYCNKTNEWFELTIEDEIKFLELCKSIEKNYVLLEENKLN